MTWPRTVGKAVQDYLEEVAPPLDESLFRSDVRAYLKAQGSTQTIDSETAAILFKITTEFLKARTAVSLMKVAQIEKDWHARKQLIRRLKRDLGKVRRFTEARSEDESKPLKNLIAEAVRKKITSLLHELDQVAQFQRLQQSMFDTLRRSTRGSNAFVSDLTVHLKHKFPELLQGERDLVIAATMIAAKVRTDDGVRDLATNTPMARYRAKNAYRANWE